MLEEKQTDTTFRYKILIMKKTCIICWVDIPKYKRKYCTKCAAKISKEKSLAAARLKAFNMKEIDRKLEEL